MKKASITIILFIIVILISIFNIYLLEKEKAENKNQMLLLRAEIDELKDKLSALEEKNMGYDNKFNDFKEQSSDIGKEQNFFTSDIMMCRDDIMRLEAYISHFKEYKTITAYIKSYSKNDEGLQIDFDECEMLSLNDSKRIKELGLDVNRDFPSAYFIYNKDSDTTTYNINDSVNFYLADSTSRSLVSKEKFLDESIKYKHLVRIVFINNKILEISQVYLP